MVQGLPEPQPGYKWVLQMPDAAPKRRSPWPWVISIGVIAVLMIAAWFAGEWLARDLVERGIRGQVVESLGVSASQQVDVEVQGAVLPQLISGTLDDVTVSSEDVAFGSFEGDVTVRATGVPVRGDAAMTSAGASVTLDEAQVQALLATVEGFPAESVGLATPNVTMSTEIVLFGASFPVGVALAPGVEEGDLTLTPASFDVAGADVSADAVRSQFGVLADLALRTWDVCVAQYIPAGLTLTNAVVADDALVVDVSIANDMLHDSALHQPGICA